MPFIAEPIQLSEQQRTDLNEIAQSRSLPAGFVFRAKLILMLAEGVPFAVIKERLQTTAPTISRWKQRFLEDGLEGLDTYHPGQPAVILTPALRAKILAATRRKPKDGSTHWSCRKLAAAINVSKDMVHRVWQEAGLKPHRLERYLASDDPDFETKAADVIGLYLNPPQHAAVFCVDEKTAIQALDRLDPVLPLSPGRAERHSIPKPDGFMGKQRRATPAPTSWISSARWFPNAGRGKRSTLFSTICRHTKRKPCGIFWTRTQRYGCTSRRRTPRG